MCGIFGAINCGEEEIDLEYAYEALRLRGPDSSGHSFDSSLGVFLGHTRLSIHDLSPLGHQPMASGSGRFEISFNGEIYNYQILRANLETRGFRFLGNSDTEVMLSCFECYGVVESVKMFVGMFAFALFDRAEKKVFLVRDRLGEKPLYYTQQKGKWVWASTLSALKAFDVNLSMSRSSLARLLRYTYIPAPASIYERVYKLPPATILTIPLSVKQSQLEQYWDVSQVVAEGSRSFSDESEAIDELDTLLKTSVSMQMEADVPLGAFLSGGVDSSLVVALMQNLSARKVKTFSMGFEDERYNEAPFASAVANHLGTDHTEHIVSASDILEVVPNMSRIYDEPFADSSQLPTYLVSSIAKQHVTVALSGDGGDELFHGYKRYQRIQQRYRQYSSSFLARIAAMLPSLSPRFRGLISQLSSGRLTQRQLLAVGKMLQEKDKAQFYHLSISSNLEPEHYVLGVDPRLTFCQEYPFFDQEFPRDYALNDTVMYLPDDILVKVDRAAMGVSLETRVPMLDHHVVEFACRLPFSLKERDGKGKWLLRELLYRYVPRDLIERPKRGFAVPLGDWLRGPLRPWVEDLLSKDRLSQQDYFCPVAISKLWREHLQGGDVSSQLWPILMFQSWLTSQR